ncbi:hypothetical protein FQ085_11740 [Planococcus sp. ANT_H30]|uniref:hypothetical protein n=1 Tax=Planococcus sp. ANT_H30 TaxID=2597347 RepID=UPI0011EC171A|nr:hypothetical protein [Planococcus sp. ANT_H30]KAA0956657.1 hypothetical protein FQ085_11740 [Planococcus sp. ANT_H30]
MMEVYEVPENQTDIFEMFEYIEKEKGQTVKCRMEPSDKKIVRLNEHHFDKKLSGKEFLDWLEWSGKKEGDLFSIEEFRRRENVYS